jgi:type VI secretion system protein ImpG
VFNKYFKDELAYLRELGREFASAYPALAPMLADRGGDPDVERLLEGVSFLTGRIRQKLDDELPEVVHSIAFLLFPHLLRPLPACTILELTPIVSVLRERMVVPPGAEFASIPVDGTSCRFRSAWPCELVPWMIEDVRLEALPRGKEQLRIRFRTTNGSAAAEVAPAKTRLHLAGDPFSSFGLLMWIHEHLDDVLLLSGVQPGREREKEREVSLGKRVVTHAGFADDEALLPFGRLAFPGYRLLQEYYVLPQKFAFLDVADIGRVRELDEKATSFDLAFRFDRPFKDAPALVDRDLVKLHCVPAVNIFDATAEPLRLTLGRERYLLRPAGLPPEHAEVYAIREVESIATGTTRRVKIPSFYDFSHAELAGDAARIFYTTHLEPSVSGAGVDVFFSFGSAQNAAALPDSEVVSVDLLATNGKLANGLRAGDIHLATHGSPAAATFKNLTAVTQHVPPPLGRELQWRVVAHAAMGLRSITEVEVLRSALDVYNLHALVDRQAARANELRIAAVMDVQVKPAERLYRGSLVRGVGIEVELDEAGFSGDGDMYLFAAMLERLFAAYVSLNSFSKTTVTGRGTRMTFQWPARTGNETLL